MLSKNIISDWQCPLLHLWTSDAKWTAWNSTIRFFYSTVSFARLFCFEIFFFFTFALYYSCLSMCVCVCAFFALLVFLLLTLLTRTHTHIHSLSASKLFTSLLLLSFSSQTPSHLKCITLPQPNDQFLFEIVTNAAAVVVVTFPFWSQDSCWPACLITRWIVRPSNQPQTDSPIVIHTPSSWSIDFSLDGRPYAFGSFECHSRGRGTKIFQMLTSLVCSTKNLFLFCRPVLSFRCVNLLPIQLCVRARVCVKQIFFFFFVKW